ncbi:MAG: cytochrome c6 [Thermoanaerobaculia bacterium]|jgi:mono/diheme cytochrome c family protein|nr:cytochrome c6 [Thermoanaerobaculia bacterium]
MHRKKHSRVTVVLIAAVVSIALPVAVFADGAALYKAKCAACHAADGSGSTTVGKNLKVKPFSASEVQKCTDAELTKMISDGKGKMPAYGKKMTPAEIESLVAVIRTMK